MSSPIRHASGVDAALRYAPPVRDQSPPMPARASTPPADPPPWHQRGDENPIFSGDRAVLEVQRQLALAPDSVPEPPVLSGDRTVWSTVLLACGAAGIAAVIAWTIVALPNAKSSSTTSAGHESASANVPARPNPSDVAITHQLQTDQLQTETASPAEQPGTQISATGEAAPKFGDRAPTGEHREADAAIADRAPPVIAAEPSPPALPWAPSAAQVVAAEQRSAAQPRQSNVSSVMAAEQPPARLPWAPSAAPVIAQRPQEAADPPAPSPIARQLDREEVASLVKRGEDFISAGDIASARLVLQRAAEAGDERAALTLAGTYDRDLLAKLGMEGAADAAMARVWYERAKQYGSAEASRRLQQLATQTP